MKVTTSCKSIDVNSYNPAKASMVKTVLWYLLFGALHELAHAFAAYSLDLHHGMMFENESMLMFLLRITFARALHLPLMTTATDLDVALVRRSGWVFSGILAIAVAYCSANSSHKNEAKTAALITSLEAIATDMLGFAAVGRATFLCGNFGLIMVNPAWTTGSDHGKTALQILKKMVEVTMMRGAQTGELSHCAARSKFQIVYF
jgi:hypothetical protein